MTSITGLTRLNQWVVWTASKIPHDARTGTPASVNDSSTWCDYQTALNAVDGDRFMGVGFVFTADDPYVFIDLDKCRDPDTGNYHQPALNIIDEFTGAAMEVSTSGRGAHIIGTSTVDLSGRVNRWDGWIECYTHGRFVAIARPADRWIGDADHDISGALMRLVPRRPASLDAAVSGGARDGRWCGPEDDAELLRRMLAPAAPQDIAEINRLAALLDANPDDDLVRHMYQQATRQRVPFDLLWNGDARLSEYYPPSQIRSDGLTYDASAADMALLNALAFWTGRDGPRMERLFSQSALGQRSKWTRRDDYRSACVGSAIATTRTVYSGTRADKRAALRAENAHISMSPVSYHQPILTVDEMTEQFIYITSTGQIINRTTGETHDNAHMAGQAYAASMMEIEIVNPTSGKITSKSVPCLPSWMRSPTRMSVSHIGWHPGHGEFFADHTMGTTATHYNTWRGFIEPTGVREMLADHDARESILAPWHEHLEYLIPIEIERVRFIEWLAHILQRPGEVMPRAYLMWTPTHGIGRNWMASVLTRVMRGQVIPNLDLGRLLDSQFNGPVSRKLLAIVDEIREGANRFENAKRENQIRQMITAETIMVNEKNVKAHLEHDRCRWLMLSNHEDAIPFDSSDRRIEVIANPTVVQPEVYYQRLFPLLDDHDFIAAVYTHLMYCVDLSNFNASEHAVMSATKRHAVNSMADDVDDALRDIRSSLSDGVVLTISNIRTRLTMEYGLSMRNRDVRDRLSRNGFICLPEFFKIESSQQRLLITDGHYRLSDLYDAENERYLDGVRSALISNVKRL